MSRDQIELEFNQANLKRNQLSNLPKSFQESLVFMDYRIRKQLKSFTLLSICGGNRQNFMVDSNFQRAFKSLSLEEKVKHYLSTINITLKVIKDLKQKVGLNIKLPETSLNLLVYNHKKKVQTTVVINQFKVLSKSQMNLNLDLRNYLMRKSKKKDESCFVLEAINNSDPETVRFAFDTLQNQDINLPIIKHRLDSATYLHMYKLLEQINQRKKLLDLNNDNNAFRMKIMRDKDNAVNRSTLDIPETESRDQGPQPLKKSNRGFEMQLQNQSTRKSICEDLIKNVEDQNLVDKLSQFLEEQEQQIKSMRESMKEEQKHTKFEKNIFRILLPNYSLEQISSLMHYGSVYFSDIASLFIYRHVKNQNAYKLQMNVKLSVDLACMAIYNIHLYKYWHPQIEEGQIKMKISSENSCILYQKHKIFNEWYRPRDFLTLIHLFKMDQSYYIAQKSIQHTYFIPFQSITRGIIQYMVWKIEAIDENQCKISAQAKIDHQGMINKTHQQQLTVRFLKGFELMQAYYSKVQNLAKLNSNMSLNWQISENTNSDRIPRNRRQSLKTVDFEDSGSEIEGGCEQEDQVFYSCEDLSQQQQQFCMKEQENSEHEVDNIKQQLVVEQVKKLKTVFNLDEEIPIQFDEKGMVILPQDYLYKRFRIQPFEASLQKQTYINNNIILKNDWELKKTGALKLINQAKIDAQNNVFSFILRTMRKNLMSGKGLLNISLPVEIFQADSNLQRSCTAMTLGPFFLQRAAATKDPIERFKLCMMFGFSNSIIYLQAQKPFNPILGETYQGYIRGCPIYGQQISHHPPISTVFFVGRGYKISVNLQFKMQIHLNSGQGINHGFYNIEFDDGGLVKYQSPAGQVTGFSFGDRGYNFKGRGYGFDEHNQLYGEIRFQEQGGFFSKKKTEYDDQVQGQIVKVCDDFLGKFIKSEKRLAPTKKQIIQEVSTVSGRWTDRLSYDNKVYYDVLNDLPDKMIEQQYPLPSNSSYREDLQYRKKNDLVRSQMQKQRLEIIQRGDRKQRQKYHGPAH